MLKKLNKKTSDENLRQIRTNFEQMGNFQKLAGEGKDKQLFNKLGLKAEKAKPTVAELSVDAMAS